MECHTTNHENVIDNSIAVTQKHAILICIDGSNGDNAMFTKDNTDGFTQSDLDMMNAALEVLIAEGIDEQNASSIINNNWQEADNTIESLTKH